MSPTIGMDVDPELEISQTTCNVLGWSEVTPVITKYKQWSTILSEESSEDMI